MTIFRMWVPKKTSDRYFRKDAYNWAKNRRKKDWQPYVGQGVGQKPPKRLSRNRIPKK